MQTRDLEVPEWLAAYRRSSMVDGGRAGDDLALRWFPKLCAAGLLALGPSLVRAQAAPGGSTPGQLQVGAGYTRANPDYSPDNFNGVTVFGDFDFNRYVGVEAVFHRIAGTDSIHEISYLGGGRVRYPVGRFEPYLRLVVGAGVFSFQQSLQNGTYRTFAGGGGVDYRFSRHVVLRADYEYQRWSSFPPAGLQPNLFTLGAAYRYR